MPSEKIRRHFIGSASEKTDSDICGKSKGNYIDKPLYKFKSLIYIAIFFFQFVRFSITFHFQDHFMTDKTINIILKAADKASGQFQRVSKAASVLVCTVCGFVALF
ncbi:hypothetical protein [Neisseria bergeri]|uniref:hypothetical protein n=1 Tax=Neisseria bergeri TaxID=1906581 RepID=UPI00131D9A63|nr:hypothetical protein [Neisseria bergeri]